MRFLWGAFLSLSKARTGNGFGPNPLPYGEIDAWCRLMQTRLDPWEVDALRRLDDAYLEAAIEEPKKT